MNITTININDSQVFGIVNSEGFFYPGNFYATEDAASDGLLVLAQDTVKEIETRYANRKDSEGNPVTKGRRSNADKEMLELAQSVVDRLQGNQAAQEAISQFLAENNMTLADFQALKAASAA